MSAVAALAVASPFAVVAVSDLIAPKPVPEQHDFTQAAVVTDLPNELMSALSQGLSQFGVNLPPLPTGLSPAGAQPLTGLSGLSAPTALGGPSLSTPGLTASSLTPGLSPAAPALTGTDLTNPALTPALTSPTGALPAAAPGLTTPLTGAPGLSTPGLTTPLTGTNPLLADPTGATGLGLPTSPIGSPTGLDPMAGTYPILGGDPSLAAAPAASGGIVSDLSSAAQQLGAGQAIDLLKGVLMPSIMGAIKSAAPAAAPPPAG